DARIVSLGDRVSSRASLPRLLGRVAEWQTRWLQVPVSFGTWGFKSPFAHNRDEPNHGSHLSRPIGCRGFSHAAVLRQTAFPKTAPGYFLRPDPYEMVALPVHPRLHARAGQFDHVVDVGDRFSG